MKHLAILSTMFIVVTFVLAADPAPADKYEVLIGEGQAGSGFIIRHNDAFYGVCSLHQFDGKTPSQFESLDRDSIKLDSLKVVKQKDVQILPVKDAAANLAFLKCDPDFELKADDEVIVLGPAGDVAAGKLSITGLKEKYQSSAGPATLEIRMDKPFLAAGGSGCPIVLKRTGAVIGVLLTADDGRQARIVGFETLCFSVKK
jgi:hypothetical protein